MHSTKSPNHALQPTTPSLAHQAAKGSWASGVIVVILLAVGRRAAPVIVEFGALALIAVGLICGISALFGIRKHGAKGILAPALLGLVIHGFLAFIFVSNFLAARAKALGQ